MKVYVDKLPKSCLECACRNGEYNHCELITPEHSIGYYNEEEMDYKDVPINQDFEELECPLQSLADYTKQVRKEVLGELKEELEKNGKCSIRVNGAMDFFIEMDKLNELLNQIQRDIYEIRQARKGISFSIAVLCSLPCLCFWVLYNFRKGYNNAL